jgi:hypothetical protein
VGQIRLIATDFEAALLEVMMVEKSPAPGAASGAGRRRAHQAGILTRRLCDNI